jgi:hypothetical protein
MQSYQNKYNFAIPSFWHYYPCLPLAKKCVALLTLHYDGTESSKMSYVVPVIVASYKHEPTSSSENESKKQEIDH